MALFGLEVADVVPDVGVPVERGLATGVAGL
jgi:hypothetical protein